MSIVSSPLDGEPSVRLVEAGPAEIDTALAAASRARAETEALGIEARAAVLRSIAAELAARAAEFADTIVLETGCPVRQAEAMQVGSAVALLQAYATLVERHVFEEIRPGMRGGRVLVAKRPIGASLGIVPWNVPLFLACMKIGPAIAAGCPIVLKPSPENARSADALAGILARQDLPPGAVAVLTGGRELGQTLVQDGRIGKVSFTGSTAAGKWIASTCAARLCRCTLELGGKSAAVLLDDFDLDKHLDDLLPAMLQNNGQVCGAQARVLVPSRYFSAWTHAIADRFDALVVGDPRQHATDVGPLATAPQVARIRDVVASAVAAGARPATVRRVLAGVPRGGNYVAPTLLVDVRPDMRAAREEMFGPVIVALPYASEEDAVAQANDSPYGLSGSVWSADAERATAVARGLRTGTVGINSRKILDFGSPFGGLRESGMGRELGPEGIDSYLESTSILVPA